MKHISRYTSAIMGALAIVAAQPTFADDSEVFTNAAFLSTGVRPNVLFIIDTSGSMDTDVITYDPTKDYGDGPCATGRIYWRTTNSATPPSCDTDNWVSEANNRCRTGALGMANNGWWRGRTAMIRQGWSSTYWGNLEDDRDAKIECYGDRGEHGDRLGTEEPSTERKYARNGGGSADSDRWGNWNSSSLVNWGNIDNVSLYSSNYMNWYHGAQEGTIYTRMDIVKRAASQLIDSLNGVNLGIMRYSTTAEGGMVRYPVSELTQDNKDALKAEIDSYDANGFTPMSETLYEAYLYLSGGDVAFGNASLPSLSIASSRLGGLPEGTTYDSPMDFSCQNTYVVYLTDGLPTRDVGADEKIEALPDFAEDGGACEGSGDGRCLEALTRYMHNHDIRPTFGEQKVTTYYIGFGDEIAESAQFLEDAAAAGGGKAYTATDAGGLASTLEEIFAEVQEASDTTFVSPAVSVNAFNRTQNLNDLFVSVFQPSKNFHWSGNVKKYQIIDGEIYGVDEGTPAVDPATGFFHVDSKALNTPAGDPADGPDATAGGSAARLPSYAPGVRKLYTYLGTEEALSADDNAVAIANAALTAEMLGADDSTQRETYIEFARGRDLRDLDKDEVTDENRFRMGDPMHAQPAIVIYSGTAESPTGTVFSPTNDGYLHALDMESGDELWAYIPQEFLPRIENLYDNPPTVNRTYALDGDVRVFKYDINQNGVVDGEDKVYLFFGTRRGGSTYYALDVTERENPKFLWQKDKDDLPILGQAWSTPEIARVNIQGATQNSQFFTLIFGAGYDPDQDGYAYTEDDEGNGIYMLDLETGALLWTAGKEGTDFAHEDMTHSIPAGITVLDTDGDFFADRMYAADVGGRVWRFDIWNGNPADTLVTGGVLASLGGAAEPTVETANRRFYGSPDVSPVSMRGSRPFFNIAIGSGYRGHPLHVNDEPGVDAAQDRFYSIRDYSPFTKLTADAWASRTPILDSDLGDYDITEVVSATIPDGGPGWRLMLNNPEWRGEKVLGDSTTAAGVVFFTTFTPLAPDAEKPCLAQTLNRVYAMYVSNGRPFTQWDEEVPDDEWDPEDRFDELAQRGIAPPVQILPNRPGPGICQVGAQILNRCVKFGDAVRSYWEHR